MENNVKYASSYAMNGTVKNWFVQDFKGHGHDTDEWRDYDEDQCSFWGAWKGVCSRWGLLRTENEHFPWPFLLTMVYRTGVSHQEKLSTPEEELHNCLVFAEKQRARTVHLVGQRPSIPLASDSGPSRFSFISLRRFSRFGENFMRETISFAVSIVSDNNL